MLFCLDPLLFMSPKYVKMIWLLNILPLNVPDLMNVISETRRLYLFRLVIQDFF